MYLSNYTDAALYAYYGVTLTLQETTPLGTLYASETFYVPAYNEAEARRRVGTLIKKSVLDDPRLTVAYNKVNHAAAGYNDQEFTTADGTTFRVPQAVVDVIVAAYEGSATAD